MHDFMTDFPRDTLVKKTTIQTPFPGGLAILEIPFLT